MHCHVWHRIHTSGNHRASIESADDLLRALSVLLNSANDVSLLPPDDQLPIQPLCRTLSLTTCTCAAATFWMKVRRQESVWQIKQKEWSRDHASSCKLATYRHWIRRTAAVQ